MLLSGFASPRSGYFILATFALTITIFATFGVAPAHGAGWSPWSMFSSPCNKSCGGGQQIKIRTCTNPAPDPSNPDDVCNGSASETFDCNTEACQSGWSDWSPCSDNCTWGTQKRWTVCGGITNGTGGRCNGSQYEEQYRKCILWPETNNLDNPVGRAFVCGNPCDLFEVKCPEYGVCQQKYSKVEPLYECICTLGFKMNEAKDACIKPPPPEPTPRPIPTLPPSEKAIKLIITKSASTVILICLSICLILFLFLRVFTVDRVIHMNMEISLAMAHILLLLPPNSFENPILCKVISILLHFFFTTCFCFMFLEALHMYSLVGFVVKGDGMLTRGQNVLIGWGLPAFAVLMTMCFCFDYYGGAYHCWLQMDSSGVVLGEFVPNVALCILTFILIEAAGSADEYKMLPQNRQQVFSAKISQRTNLFIMPLVFSSWVIGVMSEYEQNMALYGAFTSVNTVIGVLVLFCHLMANQKVREKLMSCCGKLTDRSRRGRSKGRGKK